MNCAHWDTSAYNECRESSAERVTDRDRGNRCDYFRPGNAGARVSDEASEARASLEDLFREK
jgi:hypothetical protein